MQKLEFVAALITLVQVAQSPLRALAIPNSQKLIHRAVNQHTASSPSHFRSRACARDS